MAHVLAVVDPTEAIIQQALGKRQFPLQAEEVLPRLQLSAREVLHLS